MQVVSFALYLLVRTREAKAMLFIRGKDCGSAGEMSSDVGRDSDVDCNSGSDSGSDGDSGSDS